jgi:HK97 family phage portal protein
MVWPFSRREIKEHPVGAAFFLASAGGWQKPTNARAYFEEGYQLNVIVYRAVNEITRSISDLAPEMASNDKTLDSHPALDLLARPNPTQGWDAFISEAFTNFEITGEMAIARYPETGRVIELWNINPLHITVEPGRTGIPAAYVYEQNNVKTRFPVNPINGQSQLFFYKTYNPMNYWRGQSPLAAAGLAADTHNAGMKWNYKLLRNSARPSGLIEVPEGSGGEMVARLKEWFKRSFQGENNAGEIPVLPGGAKWQPMDNNPRDMDFMNTQKEMAKLVAAAFGVPMPLIDNDASTFNNYQTAREAFYTDTIIPKFNAFLSSFGSWLLPGYGDNLSFQIDLDQVAALEPMRTRKFDRLLKAVQAGTLTVDEFREAVGYAPLGGSAAVLDPVGQAVQLAMGQAQADVQKAASIAYG